MLLFVVLINDPSFLLSSRRKKFSSLLWSQTSNCFSLVAECHPIVLRCFHKPTTSLFFSLLVFQQLRSNLLGRVLSKIICGRSWHFLLHSFISMIYLLLFLPESLWCCSLRSSSRIVKIVFFSLLIHLTGVLCSHSSSFILSSLASHFDRSAAWILPVSSRFNRSDLQIYLVL